MEYIPEKIKDIVGNRSYELDNIGMSNSKVYIYDDYVLKIQKHTEETDNEAAMAEWLAGHIPVPKLLAYCVEGEKAYTLMSRVPGKMLCDEEYLMQAEVLLDIVAESLQMLWRVDINGGPAQGSLLEERLRKARYNVEHHLVDMENVEPETFGAGGFTNPKELLNWLENNKPQEKLVLTHGDFCLPNIFAMEDKVNGFIDLGKMGPADPWQDIAIVLRSLKHNLGGYHHGGKAFCEFRAEQLLSRLGIEMDEKKMRYYTLLDELF